MRPLYDFINDKVKTYPGTFGDPIDIMRYCANCMTARFPLVGREYYEEFDLEFQFTPTTHKEYAGYYDSWEELKEWHVLTSDEIENKFANHYPEKVI